MPSITFRRIAAAMATSLVASAGIASAQIVTAGNPQSLVDALQGFGYQATLETTGDDTPLIVSGVDGSTYRIFFYGCDETGQQCKDVNFLVGFDMAEGSSHDRTNSWNHDKLVGRAYLDDENDPFLDYFVVLDRGMTQAEFERVVDRWGTAVSQYKNHVGFQ